MVRRGGSGLNPGWSRAARWVVVVVAGWGGLACVGGGAPEEAVPVAAEQSHQALVDENGLSLNGLTTNGITTNGITTNGISTNGISTNGISTNGISTNGISTNGVDSNGITTNGITTNGLEATGTFSNGLTRRGLVAAELNKPPFVTWFNRNPLDYSSMVMRYVVACALPKGERLVFTNPADRNVYSWEGNLGLTPLWTSGMPIPESEQQLLTACLAAHVNKFGVHVNFSLRGRDSLGNLVPITAEELATYTESEACFFGNLFTGEGIFDASDRPTKVEESSLRACGISAQADGSNTECPPMVHVGSCAQLCTRDRTGLFYDRCTLNGKSYRALTTRLRPQEIFTCGDGVCQVTESCGNGNSHDSCRTDCGRCPAK